MRITHAVRSDGFAGVERHVARLACAQAAAGHAVTVIGGDPMRMTAAVGASSVEARPARTTLAVARALRRAAADSDILHVHMTAAEIAATLASLAPGRVPPVVTTRHFASHRGRGPTARVVSAIARHGVAAQIAISHYVADHVDGSSVVVHPGIDGRRDAPQASARDQVVLVAQRLEPEKRTDLAIRAFAASGLVESGWRLDIAGDGSQRDELDRLITASGLRSATRLLGARSDVEDLMAHAGLLLASCPIEGFGLTVLEAMASGLPVVAAAAGGHLELLSGVDPLGLYPPADIERAGAQLAELAHSPERRDTYARAAAAVQLSDFTPAAQVAATDAVYRSVLPMTEGAP
ncbi:glycosyltransferase family 4 protein [Cellulomonas sp. P24]|uniref:glycosyltransferase family 4 protein n=1 Tax=Cellulomonas sp. P24 TaxID=2885206 RepID=UPI00216AE331|nr:glycosyltransferase family 4 protein [Cellulomonas sp. P24]MCR6493757.1 glycosyltransferase family 4 protein [Cellulomonas sp. P24]